MLTENGAIVTTTPLPASLVASSRHALSFVCHVTQDLGKLVHTPLQTFIQHLCTKIPDRAEYRSKMAAVNEYLITQLGLCALVDPLPHGLLVKVVVPLL